jgi:surface polysaccharide O-acyltransferase-like enzyme
MGENMRERMKKGSIRMFKLMVESSLLFAIVLFVTHHLKSESIIPPTEKIIDFVLLNDNPWGFHLWYLGAYLYVLLICVLIDKYNKWHIAFMITPILLITDLIMGKYSLLIMNREFPYIYVRNFLFVGLPYFLIGAYIKLKDFRLRGGLEIAWGGVIFLLFASVLENRLLVHLGLNAERDHYLTTTLAAILLFLLFLSRVQTGPTILSELGKRDSLYIYILHPLWMTFYSKVNGYLPNIWTQGVYQYIAPLIILGTTIVFVIFLRRINIIR